MSALCQKRTFCAAANNALLDHLVGTGEQSRRDNKPERLGVCRLMTSSNLVARRIGSSCKSPLH